MSFIGEFNNFGFKVYSNEPIVNFNSSEDNSGALDM